MRHFTKSTVQKSKLHDCLLLHLHCYFASLLINVDMLGSCLSQTGTLSLKLARLSTYGLCFTLKARTTKAQFMLKQSRYFISTFKLIISLKSRGCLESFQSINAFVTLHL